jgi:hypothetical protein
VADKVFSRFLTAGTAYLRDSLSAEMAGPAASMRAANPATAAWATRLGFCSCHYKKCVRMVQDLSPPKVDGAGLAVYRAGVWH